MDITQPASFAHSRFSPGSMPKEVLWDTFVQSPDVVQRLHSCVKAHLAKTDRSHMLLTGPRGCGKSHVLAVAYYNLIATPDLYACVVPAYLREEEWGIMSFRDLLIRILTCLARPPVPDATTEVGASVRELRKLGVSELCSRLVSALEGKALLTLLENFDTILVNLADSDLAAWSALLDAHPDWAIWATATRNPYDVNRKRARGGPPFQVLGLRTLTFTESARLLDRLGHHRGNHDFAELLKTPIGRARVRALRHLAGGNPRVLVILSEFLRAGDPTELLPPLAKTVDELTPYYQSQMSKISPQQRKLIEFLCEERVATSVKSIAEGCSATHQTTASQLKALLEAGYVTVTRIGREAYYELAEPLMRIAIETKQHSGEPLRILVDCLRFWFSREELEQELSSSSDYPFRAYVEAAIEDADTSLAHIHLSDEVSDLCTALTKARRERNASAIHSIAAELEHMSRLCCDWHHLVVALTALSRQREAVTALVQVAEKHPSDATVTHALAEAYLWLDEPTDALVSVDRSLTIDDQSGDAWQLKGKILYRLSRYREAFSAYCRATRLLPGRLSLRIDRADVLIGLRRYKRAEQLVSGLLDRADRQPRILNVYGRALAYQNRIAEALPIFERECELSPSSFSGWANRAQALFALARVDEARESIEHALELSPTDTRAAHMYVQILFDQRDYDTAITFKQADIVAHQIFHVFLDAFNVSGDDLDSMVQRLESHSALWHDTRWQVLVSGALNEFTGFAARLTRASTVHGLLQFAAAFRRVVGQTTSFDPPLKLLNVLITYLQTHDERVLLQLPLEQRTLVCPNDGGREAG